MMQIKTKANQKTANHNNCSKNIIKYNTNIAHKAPCTVLIKNARSYTLTSTEMGEIK